MAAFGALDELPARAVRPLLNELERCALANERAAAEALQAAQRIELGEAYMQERLAADRADAQRINAEHAVQTPAPVVLDDAAAGRAFDALMAERRGVDDDHLLAALFDAPSDPLPPPHPCLPTGP